MENGDTKLVNQVNKLTIISRITLNIAKLSQLEIKKY